MEEVENQQEQSQEQVQENPSEPRAREMGWMPKDEFKGNPDLWVDADKFIERGEGHIPIMKGKIKRLEDQLAETKKTVRDFAEYHSQVEKNAYERAHKDLKAKQVEAVAEGDVEKFQKVDQEIQELNNSVAKKPNIPNEPDASDPDTKTVMEWAEKNTWFKDEKLKNFAVNYHGALLNSKPELSLEENLQRVTKEVMKEFPEKFPKKEPPPEVESSRTNISSKKKSYNDLPSEAKEACDRFVKQGLLTRDQYVKDAIEMGII